MTLAPGTRLGPYEIVSQLGSGGMGVVYEATDPRLKRTVAIKLLPPDLTKDATAKQRFLQEAQAASALDHPNICTIFDVGETDDGQLYLVMAHYPGETLKERIERGALDLDDAIDIATQVGQGLAKAHAAGIVHRDIKPANIIVTADGVVKILDFGLAKLAGAEGVTQTGTTVGTVAYMSPEQARGQEVDHRTDIWSLGVVLYEMLAGTPPFQGENLLSLADAIRSQEPEPLTGNAASAFGPVRRALIKETARRYASVTDLVNDLKSGTGTPAPAVTSPVKPGIPSIAVLPFADMSPDKDQDYFCEGMAEEIINALTQLDNLRVAARTSAFQFKGRTIDLREVGRSLDVSSVLEGSVRKAGDRLRVTAQLINVSDGYHLWSERFDRTMEDVFAIQDEITLAIVDELRVRLLGVEKDQLLKRSTENQRAFTLYLNARHHAHMFTTPALQRSVEFSRQAIALDPNYAKAHVSLGGALMFLGGAGPTDHVSPREAYPEARAALTKALELDDRLSEAHMMLGTMRTWFERDWAGADRAFEAALALDAHTVDWPYYRAQCYWVSNDLDAAMHHAQQAVKRDPLSFVFPSFVGHLSYCLRRYDDAITQFEQVLKREPHFFHALLHLGDVYVTLGKLSEADRAYQRAQAVVGEDSSYLLARQVGLSKAMGRDEEARRRLHALEERAQRRYTPSAFKAVAYLGIGDDARMFDALEAAVDEGTALPCIWPTFPWCDPVRSDPRFHRLLERVNLKPSEKVVEHEGPAVASDGGTVTVQVPTTAVTVGPESEVPSIAVLPFLNMSADPEQEYFCDGLSEELIDALARLEGLRVVARTSAFQFRGKGHDLREVGQKLKVKTVLEGSVRKAGNRLRVNAQLINAEDGYHLWSGRYDRDLDDVFAVQDEIAGSVVEKLSVKLFGGQEEPRVKRQTNLEAYQFFLRGRHALFKATPEGFSQALNYFEQALTRQPDYAEALAETAWVYTHQSILGWAPPKELMPQAKDLALRALAMDERSAEAHHAGAAQCFWYEWDWVGAEHEFRRTIDLNPGSSFPRINFSLFLDQMGRNQEALDQAQTALELDPLELHVHRLFADHFVTMRQFAVARDRAHKTLELEATYVPAYWTLAQAYGGLEEYEEVLSASERGLSYAEDDTVLQAFRGWAYGKLGRRGEAEAVLTQLLQRRRDGYFSGLLLALGHEGLGDMDGAIAWLNHAYADRDGLCPALNTWFVFDSLRTDPRFQALLRRMNFPQQA